MYIRQPDYSQTLTALPPSYYPHLPLPFRKLFHIHAYCICFGYCCFASYKVLTRAVLLVTCLEILIRASWAQLEGVQVPRFYQLQTTQQKWAWLHKASLLLGLTVDKVCLGKLSTGNSSSEFILRKAVSILEGLDTVRSL